MLGMRDVCGTRSIQFHEVNWLVRGMASASTLGRAWTSIASLPRHAHALRTLRHERCQEASRTRQQYRSESDDRYRWLRSNELIHWYGWSFHPAPRTVKVEEASTPCGDKKWVPELASQEPDVLLKAAWCIRYFPGPSNGKSWSVLAVAEGWAEAR